MKRILTIISLAVMMMPVSCVKDNLDGHDFDQAGKGMKFTAVMEYSASKTTLEEDGDNQGEVSWSLGDQLKFDFEVGKEDLPPVISSELEEIDGGVATFHANVPRVFGMSISDYKKIVGEEMAGWRHMYVSYPDDLTTDYKWSSYHVEIPTLQDGTFASASIALAKWNPAKPDDNLNFMNLCGLLQVKIAEDDADVDMIKVTSNQVIAGMMDVGFTEQLVPFIKNDIDGSRMIQVKVHGAGTYYVAVRPDVVMENLYVELCDADGNGVGDRMAKSDVLVERSHILPLGTLGKTDTFVGEGDYFVKPEACGTKDGSSWDNAANYDTFRAKLAKSVNDEVAVVHMAAGEYTVSAVANVGATGKNYTILGGYPADATGYSLSGRDIFAHPTVLVNDETVDKHRVWNFKYGTYRIEGISFKGFKYSDGSVLQVQYTTNVTCKDCVFEDCLGTKNGGAVYFSALTSTGSVFENCSFVNNSTDGATDGGGYGGAVGAFGTYGGTIGLVTFKNCLFKGNNAKNAGGAVASRITSMRFTDCNFVGNTTTPTTDHPERSSGIFVDGSSAALSIYCDRCYFANSNNISNKHTSIIANNTAAGASICVNNSVLAGYWGYGNPNQVANTGNGLILISNSTLIAQSGAQLYSNSADARIVVINSIVANAASAKLSAKSDAGTICLNYSLCSATQVAENAVLESNNITTINIRSDAEEAIKFPTDETPWIVGSAADMKNNNRTKSAAVTDCRGKMYYYDWDGAYPAGATFINTTLDEVTALVQAADADFAEWLGANSTDSNDNRLGKDIRGEARDADSMWPGSYQK